MKKKETQAADRTDYRSLCFSRSELCRVVLLYLGLDAAAAWLFYNSLYAAVIGLPFVVFWVRLMRRLRAEERRKTLCYDFRDALNSLTVSLRAGRSVEQAFPEAAEDLRIIKGEQAPIVREFQWIAAQLRLSVPAERLLSDLAERSGSEEIENFAAVFAAAKRAGGDLPSVIRRAAETIEGRIDVEREIEMLLAAKKLEQRLMCAMPAVIILYMRLSSPGFLDVLYGSVFGAGVMSLCLLGYAGAVYWSRKLTEIDL